MAEQPRPDPEEESFFAASLQSGIRELRDRRGACPAADQLLAFAEHRLNDEDLTRIHEHIEACGLCDIALTRLRRKEGEVLSRAPTARSRLEFVLGNPMLGYGLAAVLAYPAYLGIVAQQTAHPEARKSPSIEQPAESLPIVDLAQTRGALTKVQFVPGVGRFGLRFFAPLKPGYSYAASITTASSATVQETIPLEEPDARGFVLLVCVRSAFLSGEYALIVREISSGHKEFEYVFEVD